MTRAWFITGAGGGFGKEFAKAALSRGDKVAATARDTDELGDLVAVHGDAILPLTLDVTDREEVSAAVAQARKAFGSLDVVVSNAAYGLFGAVEEVTPGQLQQQLDVNLFGPRHVTQAVLPILRAQGHGHIIQVSTVGGVASFPILGGYHASKWAREGLTEALAQEVAGFGIKVRLVARRLCPRLGRGQSQVGRRATGIPAGQGGRLCRRRRAPERPRVRRPSAPGRGGRRRAADACLLRQSGHPAHRALYAQRAPRASNRPHGQLPQKGQGHA
jgi:NAD(P)-dependent dehydrogenase (short-subunit alcohol dehydrogenase family)